MNSKVKEHISQKKIIGENGLKHLYQGAEVLDHWRLRFFALGIIMTVGLQPKEA